MAIKLIKACKELNIGMATLTAWCEKNGHAVASDPNVRIDDDLYLLLAKEFNKDMAVKIEADRQAAERAAAAEAEKAEKAAAEAAKKAAEEAARQEAARRAAEKAAAEAAKPREITSEDWRKAQRALKLGSQALFKAEDGTTRSSISINGNIYVDGDLMSFTHDGVRFTWRIQGLDSKDKKLKLKRIQARLIEQPKKIEPNKAGGGK